MSSILTNQSAIVALQTLRETNRNLGEVQDQISTGRRVANARDNAAIYAISTVIESDIESFRSINESLNLGSSTVAVGRSASEQITSLLQETQSLIVSAQEENVDRSQIQTNVAALRDQIVSITNAAQFNGLNLVRGGGSVSVLSSLDRAADGSVTASQITVARVSLEVEAQVFDAGGTAGTTLAAPTAATINTGGTASSDLVFTGGTLAADEGFRVSVGGQNFDYVARTGDNINDVARNLQTQITDAGIADISVSLAAAADPASASDTATLTITTAAAADTAIAAVNTTSGNTAGGGLGALAAIDVSTQVGAESALAEIEGLLQTSINAAASFGSAQNRIEIQSEFVTQLTDSLRVGVGALVDADLQEASARLQSLQVQQQLGTQALSIANQSPQSILALFR